MRVQAMCLLSVLSCMGMSWISSAAAAPALTMTGTVNKALRLNNGATIVAGNFTSVDGDARNGLTKLNAAGVADPAWQPSGLNGIDVVALATSPDSTRVYIATADGVRTVDSSTGNTIPATTVTVSGSVDGGNTGLRTLVVDSSGRIYLGGAFAFVNGVRRDGVARLASNATLDTGWSASVGVVSALALDAAENFIYAGGDFVIGGTTPHLRLVRLATANAAIDDSWNPLVTSNVSKVVQQLVVLPPGDAIAISGNFSAVNGTARNGIARILIASNQLDATWTPALAGYDVAAMAINNGAIYFAGPTLCCTPGFIVRANPTTGVIDGSWQAKSDRRVLALAFDGNAAVQGFGEFAQVNGTPMLGATVITAGGTTGDALPDFERAASTSAMATDASGAVVAVGNFAKVDSHYRGGVVRLTPYGSVDTLFTPPRFDGGPLYAVAVDAADGKIYVGGGFNSVDGTPRTSAVRLNGNDGLLDPSWTPNFNSGSVLALALDQGALYVGGQFNKVNGVSRSNFAKLANDGALDGLNIAANGFVSRIAISGDGLFLLGNFNTVGGNSRLHVAKLLRASGTVDALWQPTLSWTLQWSDFFDLVTVNGKAYLSVQDSIPYGGGFLLVGEIVQIDAWGTAQPIARFNQPVYDLLPTPDGRTLLVAGNFQQQYALDNPFNQIAHPAGFAQISLQPGTLGAAEAWSPAVLPGGMQGLARLGPDGLLIGGSATKPGDVFQREGLEVLGLPLGEWLFRNGFD